MTFFTEIEKKNPTTFVDCKYPAYLKKNRARGIIFPDFKLYYNGTVTKTVGIGIKQIYRPMKQNREQRKK